MLGSYPQVASTRGANSEPVKVTVEFGSVSASREKIRASVDRALTVAFYFGADDCNELSVSRFKRDCDELGNNVF